MKQLGPTRVCEEYYGPSAAYYDAVYSSDPRLQDAGFYLEMARTAKGRVLEVGCGTGRILLQLAKNGVCIDGIEPSSDLLKVLSIKAKAQSQDFFSHHHISEGNIQCLNLERKYSMIIAPFRVMQHLYHWQEQLEALLRIHNHLEEGGLFIFDVFKPNYRFFQTVGIEHQEATIADPLEPSGEIVRSFELTEVDTLNQILTAQIRFRRPEDTAYRDISRFRMSYYHYPQLQILLHAAGYRITHTFGSFCKTPLAQGNEIIIVAARTCDP